MESYLKVWKINNSLVLTIPQQIAKTKKLKKGMIIYINWQDIEPITRRSKEKTLTDATINYATAKDTITEEHKTG